MVLKKCIIFLSSSQEPHVLFLKPRIGPRSGGTQLTIGGNYLNVGTSVTVDVGGSPCQVTK